MITDEEIDRMPVESLRAALKMAMMTIGVQEQHIELLRERIQERKAQDAQQGNTGGS